jgi:hypothetical protein
MGMGLLVPLSTMPSNKNDTPHNNVLLVPLLPPPEICLLDNNDGAAARFTPTKFLECVPLVTRRTPSHPLDRFAATIGTHKDLGGRRGQRVHGLAL